MRNQQRENDLRILGIKKWEFPTIEDENKQFSKNQANKKKDIRRNLNKYFDQSNGGNILDKSKGWTAFEKIEECV